MKRIKNITVLIAVVIACIAIALFSFDSGAEEKKQNQPKTGKNLVVLELFTSEGCNSCPAAEDLLGKLANESAKKPVYILEYHVDYFDNLGWRDFYGSAENTRRQYSYSNWLNAQVYTPQLVINGNAESVGSQEGDVRKEIANQQSIKHGQELNLTVQNNATLLVVNYQIKNAGNEDELVLALVQKKGVTNVLNGENAGRSLDHIQMVRKLSKVSLNGKFSGTTSIIIPGSLIDQKWELIGLLQNKKTGEISAAQKV